MRELFSAALGTVIWIRISRSARRRQFRSDFLIVGLRLRLYCSVRFIFSIHRQLNPKIPKHFFKSQSYTFIQNYVGFRMSSFFWLQVTKKATSIKLFDFRMHARCLVAFKASSWALQTIHCNSKWFSQSGLPNTNKLQIFPLLFFADKFQQILKLSMKGEKIL